MMLAVTNTKRKAVLEDLVPKQKSGENVESRGQNYTSSATNTKRKERRYIRWTDSQNVAIRQHFQKYIFEGGLPGRKEIEDFLADTEIPHPAAAVYTKVFNEQRTASRRADRRLQEMKDAD